VYDKKLLEKAKLYYELKNELDRAKAEYSDHCKKITEEGQARFDTLATNIQRFCGSESFRSVIKNFCYLHPQTLSVQGGNLLYHGILLPPVPIDASNVFEQSEQSVRDIKETVQMLVKKIGDTDAHIKALCVNFATLRSIYAKIGELKRESERVQLADENAKIRSLTDKISEMVSEFPILASPAETEALIAQINERKHQKIARFRMENVSVNADYRAPIVIPFAQKITDPSEDSAFFEWDPLRDGILHVEASDGNLDAAIPFIRAIALQFLYSYPGMDKQLFYGCRSAKAGMDRFLAALGNQDRGVGDEIFFCGIQQIEHKNFKRDISEHFTLLREMTQRRLELLDQSNTETIYEYNAAYPKNIQKPLLVILNDYPAGFESCVDLDYLLQEGAHTGILYLIVQTHENDPNRVYDNEELVETRDYTKLHCRLLGKQFFVNEEECIPSTLSVEKERALIAELANVKKTTKKTSLSYEEIGFGSYVGEDAFDSISIPIANKNNDVYHLKFTAAEGTDPIAYLLLGKPKSGKSSLIDAMIINGSMAYSPDDLTFYLLDFKDGISSNVYKGKNAIPHIRVIAEKNKQEDAEIILSELIREKERRSATFKKLGLQNIAEYNRASEVHMPRIIIVVDECQALFESSALSKQVEGIARQGRAYGIHLVLASQSITSDIMKSAGDFIDGRFCFAVNTLSDAERILNPADAKKTRIELSTGSGYAFVSSDAGTSCEKLRVAWHGGSTKIEYYNRIIREKWAALGYEINLTIAGEKTPLKAVDLCEKKNVLATPQKLAIPFAQNYFNHSTECFDLSFSEDTEEKQSVILLGKNETTATHLLTSLLTGALRANAQIKLIDETRKQAMHHFFANHPNVESKSAADGYMELLQNTYKEFQKRKKNHRERYSPYFLILHRLERITDFTDNTSCTVEEEPDFSGKTRIDLRNTHAESKQSAKAEKITGRETLMQMIKNIGLAPDLYIVITTDETIDFGDFSSKNIIKLCSYKILQSGISETVHGLMDNTFKDSMLNGLNENMILIATDQQYVKARFFQYDLTDPEDKKLITEAVKGENA